LLTMMPWAASASRSSNKVPSRFSPSQIVITSAGLRSCGNCGHRRVDQAERCPAEFADSANGSRLRHSHRNARRPVGEMRQLKRRQALGYEDQLKSFRHICQPPSADSLNQISADLQSPKDPLRKGNALKSRLTERRAGRRREEGDPRREGQAGSANPAVQTVTKKHK
jgi:hypothetical protein